MQNQVAVIIVNWNGIPFLADCLDSLRGQVFKNFSIILVDNGSKDGSLDFVKKHYAEITTMAFADNLGFASANNHVLRRVQTKYVALLNNDTVVHPLWLKSLTGALDTYSEAGFAASKMLSYYDQTIIDRAGDSYSKAGTGILRGRGKSKGHYNQYEWVFGACAGAALYRTQMLQDIGLFDDDLFLLYEDVDLSFRAQLRGYKCLYVPEAVVYHKGSASIGQDTDVSVYYSHRNLEWVYLKNMPRKLLLRSLWLHLLYDIAALLFFLLKGKLTIFAKAKIDFLRNFKKIIRQRALIQKNKKVDDQYIWNLFENELFLPRLLRRFKKTHG
jgi:hypothetical protein